MMQSTPNFGPGIHLPVFLPTPGLRRQHFMPMQSLPHPPRWPRRSSELWIASDGKAAVRKFHLVVMCTWCHP
jgi:hypothetical protein